MQFIKKEVKISNKEYFDSLCKKFNVSSVVMELLFARGYTTEKAIQAYLQPSISCLYNPFLLKGMDDAVKKIKQHVASNHTITILGDYDTDGICATAILEHYLLSIGAKVTHFLPNRFVDGYGMTMDTIDKIRNAFHPDLLITVDCGISCYAEIEYAKSFGIEVVVTDHHELPDKLPDCITVDPKIPSDYPFNGLCGAGVVLKLVHALGGVKECLNYTPICALATVADIVPLIDENRIIVSDGLKKQAELPKGVLALIKKLKLKSICSTDISMKLAPKINTAGRMGDPSIAYDLFVEQDDKAIASKLRNLFELNDKRVQDGNDILEECLELLKGENLSQTYAIVLKGEHWNSGVLGIICSRLVELYHKPVFLMARVEEELKGSARSIEGIDINKVMNALQKDFIRFGGHSQAGGFSIRPDAFDKVKNDINEMVKQVSTNDENPVVYYDIDLPIGKITTTLVNDLEKLQPYGFANEKPIFKIGVDNVSFTPIKTSPQHIKAKYGYVDFICYQGQKYLENLKINCEKTVLGELSYNIFGSKKSIQVNVKNFMFGPLRTAISQDLILAKYVAQLKSLGTKLKYDPQYKSMDELIKIYNNATNKGIAILAYQFSTYQAFIKNITKPVEFCYQKLTHKTDANTIIFLPDEDIDYSNFHTIILLDQPLIKEYLSQFEAYTVLINNQANYPIFANFDTDRTVFAYTHKALQTIASQNKTFDSLYDYYTQVKKLIPNIKNYKYQEFYFILCVFEELGFIEINNNTITILPSTKKELASSCIYQFVSNLIK